LATKHLATKHSATKHKVIGMSGLKFAGAGLLLALLVSPPAHAQTASYPSRTIKIIVGFAAGGGVDIVARLLAQKMQESLGQNVIVENRTGGNGMLGPDTALKSAPDGYTLLYAASGQMVVSPAVYAKMPYATLKDSVPISMVASYPLLLVTNANHPSENLKDFIAWTKANPDKTNYATTSPAFTLSSEYFKLKTGTPGQVITYRSSNESVTSVIGNQTTYAIVEPPPAVAQVAAGKVRALGVLAPKRLAEMPNVPTMTEQGVDMKVVLWSGLFAPAGTPQDVVKKLEAECIRIAQLPDVKEKLRALSTDSIGGTSIEFVRMIDQEIKMWSGIAKEAKLSFE
jgi:tripartite-type tricarboxylate transporter receptor subunit TctC